MSKADEIAKDLFGEDLYNNGMENMPDPDSPINPCGSCNNAVKDLKANIRAIRRRLVVIENILK